MHLRLLFIFSGGGECLLYDAFQATNVFRALRNFFLQDIFDLFPVLCLDKLT